MTEGQDIATDKTGFETLYNISGAEKFNHWIFESISPYLSGNILEIGSGIGNISSVFISKKIKLTLSDVSEEYCLILKNKFSLVPDIRDIFQINLEDENFDVKHAALLGTFDCVFALNVIEHIENDTLAIENCHKLLTPSGRLVLLMPAYPFLFNRFDVELGHFRRYNKISMRKLFGVGFEVLRIWHFNLAGIFGWLLFGTILRRKNITKNQIAVYDKFVPIFRLFDKASFYQFGLSVIGVGQKQ